MSGGQILDYKSVRRSSYNNIRTSSAYGICLHYQFMVSAHITDLWHSYITGVWKRNVNGWLFFKSFTASPAYISPFAKDNFLIPAFGLKSIFFKSSQKRFGVNVDSK